MTRWSRTATRSARIVTRPARGSYFGRTLFLLGAVGLVLIGVVLFRVPVIEVQGAQAMSPEVVLERLPVDLPLWKWLLHVSEYESSLERHALVANARIGFCDVLKPWCLRVSLYERTPSFIIYIGLRPWLVGDDGGFIAEVPSAEGAPGKLMTLEVPQEAAIGQEESGHGSPTRARLPVIRGVVQPTFSPDMVRAAIDIILAVLRTIENSAGLSVEGMTLEYGRGLYVKFYDWPAVVTFSPQVEDLEKLRIETVRLEKVRKELGERLLEADSVDVAFKQQAVVRFKQAPPQATSLPALNTREAKGSRESALSKTRRKPQGKREH